MDIFLQSRGLFLIFPLHSHDLACPMARTKKTTRRTPEIEAELALHYERLREACSAPNPQTVNQASDQFNQGEDDEEDEASQSQVTFLGFN